MTQRSGSTTAIAAAGLLALSLALTGCGLSLKRVEQDPGPSAVATTAQASPSATASWAPSGISTAMPSEGAKQKPGTVAKKWKKFADAEKTVSFELPEDWTVKVLPPPPVPDALALEVRNAQGTVMAMLGTHISGLGGACPDKSKAPYTVLASIPMDIPSNNSSDGAVDPRYVYRVIQGSTHFFASYGITDHSAGADGTACLVYNTVTSKQLGIYMFGDALQFTSDPSGTPGLRAFATIADAQAYMLSSEYQNIQKMVTSLKSLG
ncbi:hypothetical protein JOF48_002754 [Arthrobacter stackebrandtii]|uniref:Lipoprotein n=1 Tax=Arthrobacter stackebrandtii TaxID=272161 RepID=A0ABS4YZF3_9MICC|nr:hypothetical protein [Arthrobacter stackebrandtii]MBP2413955.1 hypothetical protein [Arthrobacter stackebrandtii]